MLNSSALSERDWLTAQAFADPRPGDRFHEMFSFWMYVVAVEPDGRVAVLTASPPCSLPGDGKIEIYPTHDAYRAYWAYESIPGYSISLGDRGNDVTGWFPGWPTPEPDCRHCADLVARITRPNAGGDHAAAS